MFGFVFSEKVGIPVTWMEIKMKHYKRLEPNATIGK